MAAWLTYEIQKALLQKMIDRAWSPIDYTDYTEYWILHRWLHELDQTWQITRYSDKQAHMQGATMGSVYWSHRGRKKKSYKFIHTKQKDNFYTDKISFKNDTKCIIYTHRRSDRPIRSKQICIWIRRVRILQAICT